MEEKLAPPRYRIPGCFSCFQPLTALDKGQRPNPFGFGGSGSPRAARVIIACGRLGRAGLAAAVELAGRGNFNWRETVLKPGTVPGVSLGCPRDAGCAPPAALAFALSSLLCHQSHSQGTKSTPLQQACAETCVPLQKPDLFSSACVGLRFLSSHSTNNYTYWEQVVGRKGQ